MAAATPRGRARFLAACAACLWAPAQAQEPPMSAIDWLSDSVRQPVEVAARPPVPPDEQGVAGSASPADVTVIPLGSVSPDAAGLLPVGVTGFPRTLWGPTGAADLARLVRAERTDLLPAPGRLLQQILLAEVDPPFDADARGVLLLARVDKLLDLGALDAAAALLAKVGSASTPEIFRRRFDVALLTGTEDAACAELDASPALSPTYPARIFCQAHGGDWATAVLIYGTARALGFLDARDAGLVGRFLDPALYEDESLPEAGGPVTPLDYRLLEAIGEPPATAALPRAFAQLDLRPVAGWKAQIEAAERLSRAGAIDPGQLHSLYTERRPAASGGVWERAAAIQELDGALASGDAGRVAPALLAAWDRMAAADLEPALAMMLRGRLAGMALEGAAGAAAFRLALLTPDYEAAAQARVPVDARETFLIGLARGIPGPAPRDPLAAAVARGFSAGGAPPRLASLIGAGRIGEAILRAIDLVTVGATGEMDELTDGLATLRALGLEDTARRTALELLVLDRRG